MDHSEQPLPPRPPERETAFFAAANTEDGFYNGYPALFGGGRTADRLYVIKGGPGTGKSRFMRTVSRVAEAQGRRSVRLYCSSDPASLDGVILFAPGKPTLALVDGTPPHTWEPARPGVREELVDLGAFWDADKLRRSADTIGRLADEKAAAYRRAYHYLQACGQADCAFDSLVDALADKRGLVERAERLIRGSLRGIRRAEAGDRCPDLCPGGTLMPPLFRKAYGMTGCARLDTLDRAAVKLLCVGDRLGLGSRLLNLLYESSVRQGLPVTATRAPLRPDRIDGILFHDTGLCVLNDRPADCAPGIPARALDLRRCADAEKLHRLRSALREAAALRDDLKKAALRQLADVRDAHFGLESLYSASMDFAAKERFTEDFCRRVLT